MLRSIMKNFGNSVYCPITALRARDVIENVNSSRVIHHCSPRAKPEGCCDVCITRDEFAFSITSQARRAVITLLCCD